ncbi:bifunctional metallophosphatase/5'-nucleotidase [Helicobacter pylori]|uniref:2',3'-cyclic-nucleotide 2'-phosphodiesterase n=1 Tax=Helicobacter pylori (strain SouthAfrica7) TaxID=907239 RepID=E8QVB0_HELPW|nr:5'-nucleotidase C-terminal domain-containing protein [Helicobacter pylori]ADU84381.1 2',3'-cyclic-nucleotide 2'-phosphodiesterase [Helicobacter pylori SouthAfrica7]
MKKLILATFLALTLSVFAKEVKIVFLETSDIHGRLFSYDYAVGEQKPNNGLTRIATLIKKQRAENKHVILIDSGDLLQGNSAELFNDEPIHPLVRAENDLKFDIRVLGNHEFNFSKSFLEKNIKGFNGAVVNANIIKTADNKPFVKPYLIKNIDGVRVAVVGYLVPHVPTWEASTPEHFAGLKFLSAKEALEKTLKELKGKYDILIGAFHLGREDEKGGDGIPDLAKKFPQFDIIFAGHEHAVYNTKIGKVHTIEPGAYGAYLAKGVVVFDTKTKKKTITTENLPTKDVPEDEELAKKYEYVDQKSKKYANEVVGEVTKTFIERPDFITGEAKITTMPTATLQETSVIALINKVQKYYAKADVSAAALFNFGANLKKGPFRRKDVAFIYKFTNTLIGVDITGENLLKYMEWSYRFYNQLQPGDLTISFDENIRGYNFDMFSGVKYQVDVTKPAGQRIINPTINGKPIDPKAKYKLAINNYRFGTLSALQLVTNADRYYDSYDELQDGGQIRELIIQYITEEKGAKVTPELEHNWEIVNYNFKNPLLKKLAEKLKEGSLKIPTSKDGRTLNIKSIKESEVE